MASQISSVDTVPSLSTTGHDSLNVQTRPLNSRQRRLLRRKTDREKHNVATGTETPDGKAVDDLLTVGVHKRKRDADATTDAAARPSKKQAPAPADDDDKTQSVETKALPAIVPSAAQASPAWRKPITFKHRFVAAPMVDASELGFRMLVRSYNTDCCYTPMFYSKRFVEDESYRQQCWQSCPEDRPLIVQFCANDRQVLLAAAKLVEDKCDAIDINLGCPLKEARNQRYGAYLLDEHEQPMVLDMVQTVSRELKVPLTCKIRILPTVEETVNFALKLQAAGCAMLAVHARHRTKPREKRMGAAKLEFVMSVRRFLCLYDSALYSAVKRALSIPVITNGNTRSFRDVKRNLGHTKADGLMSAEGLLANPAMFANQKPDCLLLATEYLTFAEKYSAPFKWALRHVNKMCKHEIGEYGLRDEFDKCESLDAVRRALVSCMVRRDAQAKTESSGKLVGLGCVDRSLPRGAKGYVKPRDKPRQRMAVGRPSLAAAASTTDTAYDAQERAMDTDSPAQIDRAVAPDRVNVGSVAVGAEDDEDDGFEAFG